MAVDARRSQQIVFDLLEIGVADAAASTRTSSSPGPISGVGTASTDTTLCRVDRGPHGRRDRSGSESTVGNKVSQACAAGHSGAQPEQLRQSRGRRSAADQQCVARKMAVGSASAIEVDRKTFLRQVGHRPDAIKRQPERSRRDPATPAASISTAAAPRQRNVPLLLG